MSKPVRVTVLVPCYNEEATIVEIRGIVREQEVEGVELEVVVVDDGSTDRTRELLAAHPELYDKLILCEQNGGKGAAVRRGLQEASGEFVLFQDADLEYDPTDYPRLLRPVVEHDADIVFGSRMVAPACTRVAYFWHKIGNRLITLSFNVLNNTTFTDIYSCYLCLRLSLLDEVDLEVDGWAQQAEILGKAMRRAKRMYEVPINYYGRTYEEGKKIRWYHMASVISTIVSTRVSRSVHKRLG